MKKYTFLLLLLLVFSVNVTHSMDYTKHVYKPTNYKNMPLHMAVYQGNQTEIEFLLKIKIDVNQQDERGDTPLHIATAKGNAIVVLLLLKHGAEHIPNNQSYSPSDIANANRNRQIYNILTNHWVAKISELL